MSLQVRKSQSTFMQTVYGSTQSLARLHRRIKEKTEDRSAAPVLIVALGDSVTQGIGQVDHVLHHAVYHEQLRVLLQQRYDRCIFNVLNAGVDGNNAGQGLARFDRDVVRHQPDLLLISFGLNDAADTEPTALIDYKGTIETMIHRARAETSADVILITPNMMLMRDNEQIATRYRALAKTFLQIQQSGRLAQFAECMRAIGRTLYVPVADVYGRWERLIEQGVDITSMLANGLNHPHPEGHRLTAELLMQIVDAPTPTPE